MYLILSAKNVMITGALALGLLLTNTALAHETDAGHAAEHAAETNIEEHGERQAIIERVQAEQQEIKDEQRVIREESIVTREDIVASNTLDRAEKRAKVEEHMDERKAIISERAKERITNLAANVSNRMEAAIARIQNVIDRVNTRIIKLEGAGLDVSEAQRIMASAQTSLDAAAAQIETIDVEVNAAVTAEDPRKAWQTVKAKYQSIRDQLRTAHSEIKAAIQALKDSAQDARGERDVTQDEETDIESEDESEGTNVTNEAEVETSI